MSNDESKMNAPPPTLRHPSDRSDSTDAESGNKKCPDDDLLATFVQGAAANKEREYIEQHLDTCVTCRDLLAQLAETYSPHSRKKEKAPSTPPLFGSIDRYELLDVVGKGAMGTVYEARDPVLGRHIAVKVIEHSTDEARLLREGRAMARVAHPNVVTVHDAGVDDGRVFIAMELVRGTSLREHLQKNAASLTIEARIALFIDAARGLAAAHAANVIHRDFKPENVVVSTSGSVVSARVTDFGLARPPSAGTADIPPTSKDIAPTSNDMQWLAEGTTQGLHGTPAYICPEQLDGKPVDERSDQFSFAVALYEALFGTHPFGLGTVGGPSTLTAVRTAMARTLVKPFATSKMPAFVWPVIERAIRVNPEERWPSMTALADALQGPDEKTRRQISMLVASLSVMAVVHIVLMLFVIIAIVLVGREPEEPGGIASTADVIAGTIFFTWAPLGVPLTLLSAYGIARQRRWAYLTTVLYAVLAFPSCFGTPFAVFATYVLTRPSLRRVFGR